MERRQPILAVMALLCCVAAPTSARMWHQRCYCHEDTFIEIVCLVKALGGLNVVGVAAGLAHTVACTDSGDVYSWGWNADGQLGLGDDSGRAEPELVSDASLEHEHIEQVMSLWPQSNQYKMLVGSRDCSFGWVAAVLRHAAANWIEPWSCK